VKGFKTIPPKQKYMSLAEIYKTFGSRAVVAYGCRVKGGAPLGGYVIAVQDGGGGYAQLKEYMRQFAGKYPARKPVFFIRFEAGDTEDKLNFVYDSGSVEAVSDTVDEIKEVKSKIEKIVDTIPAELLAQALKTSLYNVNENNQ
jgi:hypothetical protein